MHERAPRCHCHKKERPRGVIIACDILLASFIAICVVLMLVYAVLPWMGVTLDLSVITKASFNGLWIAIVMVVLNIFWAIYYGCQKSTAGVGLSVMTALMVAYSYGML